MIEAGIRVDLEEDNVRGRETNQIYLGMNFPSVTSHHLLAL